MKVLVLGASGLLGHAVLRELWSVDVLAVFGTIRSAEQRRLFPAARGAQLVATSNLEDEAELRRVLETVEPELVINCVAMRRIPGEVPELSQMVAVYALLPRRLGTLCARAGIRLVQISSDGVFSGRKGGYTEDDCPDATDPYGTTKFLGEAEPPAMTIRTSILGHELTGKTGLLEWFLTQEGQCRGLSRAIFSGLPTIVLARILREIVLPRPDLTGLFHVSAQPISKCNLLRLIAEVYRKQINIIPDDRMVIDRSLKSDKFRRATGYVAPDWPELIRGMYSNYMESRNV
jgi:dTDP-4-dehydrorhamnose reductase